MQILPATIEELPRPLAVGVIRLEGTTAQPELLTSGDLPAAVAASCAVPRLFAPIQIGSETYADGGAVDRSAVVGWRGWRPGRRAILNLVTDLPPPQLGARDGFAAHEMNDLLVVRTPRANASLFSLGDFEAERDRACELTVRQLDEGLQELS